MQIRETRYFTPIKHEYIFLIQKWRNAQINILRQRKKINLRQQIAWFDSLKNDKTQKLFAIFEKTDSKKRLIGYCGLTHIDYFNHRAEVSFLVDAKRTQIDHLYKTDMLNALLFLAKYAFLKLKLKKIFTETYEFRKNHIKILELFGFKKEGVLRSQVLLGNKFYNSIIHSLLRDEFD